MDIEQIKRDAEDINPATFTEVKINQQEIYNTALHVAKAAAPEYLAEIAAVIDQSKDISTLSDEAAFIWGVVIAAFVHTPIDNCPDQLAEAIGTTADKLAAAIAEIITPAIKKSIEEQEGDYLPGCAPDTLDLAGLLPLPKIDYTKGLLIPTSVFNRKIPHLIGAENRPLPLDIPGNVDLSKSKKKIIFSITQNGKPETITPYDLEVENALSNLFEDGHKEVTTQHIYAKMNGLTGTHGRSFSPGLLQEVKASIDKLANLKADITIIDGNNTSHIKGNILDTFYWERCFKTPGQKKEIKSGWISTRPGLFFQLEKKQGGRLKSTQPEQLNLSASGISITPLTQMIRRFCLEEISRIAAAPSHETHKNKFLLERFYTYDLDPTLTEVTHNEGEGVEVKPRQGETANEKSKIRMAKKHRRELLQDILEHLKNTGALNSWDFVDKDKKITYTLVTDEKHPQKKRRKYAPADIARADGVILTVTKTPRTISRIASKEGREEKSEKNARRTKKKSR